MSIKIYKNVEGGERVKKEKLLSIKEEIKNSNTLYNTMLEILFLNLDKNSEKIKNLDNLEEKLKSCQDSVYRTIEEIEKIILIIQD
jgi:hypothetical protein|nr:MAG TPA: hypothetical protein [Caudoviricetes sp.]